MSEHKYNEAYSKGYRDGQKDQCLADAIDDALAMLSKVGIITNGDIIKAMFPYINDKPNRVQDSGDMIVIYIDMGFGWRAIKFEKDWWNAPYRG